MRRYDVRQRLTRGLRGSSLRTKPQSAEICAYTARAVDKSELGQVITGGSADMLIVSGPADRDTPYKFTRAQLQQGFVSPKNRFRTSEIGPKLAASDRSPISDDFAPTH